MTMLEVTVATVSSEPQSSPGQNSRQDANDDCEDADYNIDFVISGDTSSDDVGRSD